MSMTLQYNYAFIIVETGFCGSCLTCSDEVLDPTAIPVPYATDDYVGKYYNASNQMVLGCRIHSALGRMP